MGRGLWADVGKPPVNEPAGWDVVRCGLWGFDGGGHCGFVPAVGTAGTLVSLFAAGVGILAACKPVEAAVWPRRLAAICILARAGSPPAENRRQRQEACRGGD